ncbi:hypothetical protein PPACK8108_LOCUS8583 [Phakopsora pachyrhizi]|uniref:Uncharacterized protein n=1 Tax=Phakopsora pachyrhizi TaxID=170000 RepID=A0AAV0AUX8_PHAPC|nr:hypothetical protein PPACK8108_LOCUS8583 [Phakopsora pachyrhizi]
MVLLIGWEGKRFEESAPALPGVLRLQAREGTDGILPGSNLLCPSGQPSISPQEEEPGPEGGGGDLLPQGSPNLPRLNSQTGAWGN